MRKDLTELEIQARVNHLITMDEKMRNLDDEDLVMVWLAYGVPDMAVWNGDWDILRFIATYEDETGSSYQQAINLYNHLLAASEED